MVSGEPRGHDRGMNDASMPTSDPGAVPPRSPRLGLDLYGLRRSRSDRVVAGVLGGLGRRLGVDPLVLRIATVVLALFGGIGIMIYAAGWLLIPADDEDASVAEQALGRHDTGTPRTATIALAGALALVLLGSAAAVIGGSADGVVLLVLAGLGLVLLLRRDDPRRGGDRGDEFTPPDTPGAFTDYAGFPDYPGFPGYRGSASSVTSRADDPATAGAATATDAAADAESPASTGAPEATSHSVADDVPSTAAGNPLAADETAPTERWWAQDLEQDDPQAWATRNEDWDPFAGSEPVPAPTATKRPRSALGPLTVSAAVVTVGAIAVADALGASVPHAVYHAAPLAIVGLGLLVGAWWGRSRGLIILGVLLALAMVPAVVVDDTDFNGEDFSITPTTQAAIPTGTQDHGVGSVTYDLSRVDFTDGESASLTVDQGVGELRIIVPPDVDVDVNADVGIGEIRTFDGTSGGLGQERRVTDLGTDGRGGGDLRLDLELGIGSIEVRREAP
jgi:phage shock protein PspC (stress-responsive transcriptional regulator)